MSHEPTLAFQDVHKAYALPGGQPIEALRGVSLSVTGPRAVSLIGRSGSGKSTFLHLAAGIDAPTWGTVRLMGRDLGALSDRERTLLRRDAVGLVFQFGTICSLNVGHVVYFKVTPQVTGNVTVSTCHPMTMYDTVLDVMSGGSGCEWFTLVGCNDDSTDAYCDSSCSGRPSKMTFWATAGTTYRIRVGSYNQSSAGCELCLGLIVTIGEPCGEPPRNIVCQTALALPGTPGSHEMEVDATETPLNTQTWSCPSNISVSHPVWYKFTPTVNGTATLYDMPRQHGV